MEQLFGNFWFHDDGSGQVSVYERIGRRYLPVRVESEGWPERLPFETQQLLQARLTERLQLAEKRSPTDVKLSNLETLLAAFPGYESMTPEAREALKRSLVGDKPELQRPAAPVPALPERQTVEAQVEAENRKARERIDQLAQRDTEILRLRAQLESQDEVKQQLEALSVQYGELLKLKAELEALKEKSHGDEKEKEVTKGQDAAGTGGVLGEETRKEDGEKDPP